MKKCSVCRSAVFSAQHNNFAIKSLPSWTAQLSAFCILHLEWVSAFLAKSSARFSCFSGPGNPRRCYELSSTSRRNVLELSERETDRWIAAALSGGSAIIY